MNEYSRALAEAEAYAFRLTMLRIEYAEGKRETLLPAAAAYADHLQELRAQSPGGLHGIIDDLITEYRVFALLCVN